MRSHSLWIAPLLILAACTEQSIVAPDQALFNKKGGGGASHEIVLLGTLPNHSASWAVGINESNVIVGASWSSGTFPVSSRIVRWSDGALEDLGNGQPHGLNNVGAVVAWADEGSGWPLFVLAGGTRTPLENGLGTGWRAYRMINDAGTVIGHRGTVGGDGRLWTAGTGVWDGASYDEPPATFGFPAWCVEDEAYDCESITPYAISNGGDVVGDIYVHYTHPDGTRIQYSLAAIWRAGDYQNPVWLLRGPGGATHRFARGVNDTGWIVGAVGLWRAAVWIPDATGAYGSAVELPHSGSARAYAVSEPDEEGLVQIVGDADDHAALWTVTRSGVVTGPIRLGTPNGQQRSEARAINTNGWVVGNASNSQGRIAVLWRPVGQGGDNGGDDGGPCTHPRGKC
jgi:hypothetical protein